MSSDAEVELLIEQAQQREVEQFQDNVVFGSVLVALVLLLTWLTTARAARWIESGAGVILLGSLTPAIVFVVLFVAVSLGSGVGSFYGLLLRIESIPETSWYALAGVTLAASFVAFIRVRILERKQAQSSAGLLDTFR